jgi:hypothetical protein
MSFTSLATQHRKGLLTLWIVASFGVRPLPAEVTESPEPLQLSEERARGLASLKLLAGGDDAARLKIAEDACAAFAILESIPPQGPESGDLIQQLRSYLRDEPDDWVADRFLEQIGCHTPMRVMPLFLDSLAGASPNRRRRAYQWFSRVEEPGAVPLLEQAWTRESRPWAQLDLIKALSRNGSARFLREFMNLAESDDPRMASAAIGALKAIGDERVVPLLVRMTEDSEEWRRRESADALGAWPESQRALDALLMASGSEGPWVRRCAVQSLARMRDPSGMVRVLAIAMTDPEEAVRRAGVAALNDSGWKGLVDQLIQVSSQGPQESVVDVENYFRGIMTSLSIWGRRDSLTPDPGAGKRRERDPGCLYLGRGGLDPSNPDSLRAAPPAGLGSARCFQRPEVPGDPGQLARVPRASLLFVEDHFESPRGAWSKVVGFATNPCWLPAGEVVPASELGNPAAKQDLFQREFDLPSSDLDDSLVREMIREGMIKVIEPGDDRAGVSLRVALSSPGEEDLLRRAASNPGTLLGRNILRMILDAGRQACDYPLLIDLARELGDALSYCPVGPRPTDPAFEGSGLPVNQAR